MMSPPRVLILAAGRGLRMNGGPDSVPKCLLSLGDETILQYQLRVLKAAGIRELAIVTGYRADLIRQTVCDPRVHYVHNAEYETTNSLFSFLCAREFALPGTLVLNSDVVFHPLLLAKLIETPRPNALIYEPRRDMGDEEMKISLDPDGAVVKVSKVMDNAEVAGENLGLVKFGPGTVESLLEVIRRRQPERLRNLWLPESINLLQGIQPFHALEVGGLPWTEIDFIEDLEYARDEIYPQCNRALSDRPARLIH